MNDARFRHSWQPDAACPWLPLSQVAQGAIWAITGSLVLLASLLIMRRGAMVHPLATPALLMVGLCLACAAVGVVSLMPAAWPGRPSLYFGRVKLVLLVVNGGLLLAIAATLTSATLNQTGLAALWLPILMAIAILFAAWRRGPQTGWRSVEISELGTALRPRPEQSPIARTRDDGPADPRPDEQLFQHLTRSRTANGSERVSGRLLVEFATGQRTATVHVAFCPAFRGLPKLAAAETDSGAKVKVTQVMSHGARLEVKLASPATRPTTHWLEFTASGPPSPS